MRRYHPRTGLRVQRFGRDQVMWTKHTFAFTFDWAPGEWQAALYLPTRHVLCLSWLGWKYRTSGGAA